MVFNVWFMSLEVIVSFRSENSGGNINIKAEERMIDGSIKGKVLYRVVNNKMVEDFRSVKTKI